MKKKILMCGIALLAVALILGGMFWMKEHYYRCAQRSEALGRYELAAQEYEQAGRYKDAEEKMAEMTQLATVARTELLKLFPIPGLEEEHEVTCYYICQEFDELMILYKLNHEMLDVAFQWAALDYDRMTDEEVENNVYKLLLLSYDSSTGEYLFNSVEAQGYVPFGSSSSGDTLLRGTLDSNGNIVVYTQSGEEFAFEPDYYVYSITGERDYF